MGATAGELRGHAKDDISGLAFSPDGSLLASAGDDRTVRVWDVRQRKQLSCLVGHADWVSAVTFLGDNATLASAGADRTILVWEVTNGKAKRRLAGHTDIVRALAFQRRNRVLLSAAEDGTVRTWDPETGSPSPLFPNGKLENPGGYWMRSLCPRARRKNAARRSLCRSARDRLGPAAGAHGREPPTEGRRQRPQRVDSGRRERTPCRFWPGRFLCAREAVWIARRCARAAGTCANGRRRGSVSRWECSRIGLARRQRASVEPSPERPRRAEAPPRGAGLHRRARFERQTRGGGHDGRRNTTARFQNLEPDSPDPLGGGTSQPHRFFSGYDHARRPLATRAAPALFLGRTPPGNPRAGPVRQRSDFIFAQRPVHRDRRSLSINRGRRHPPSRYRPSAAQVSAPGHRVPRRLDRVDIQPRGRPVPLVVVGRARANLRSDACRRASPDRDFSRSSVRRSARVSSGEDLQSGDARHHRLASRSRTVGKCLLSGGGTHAANLRRIDATLSLANQHVAPHGPAGNRLDPRGARFRRTAIGSSAREESNSPQSTHGPPRKRITCRQD